MQVQLWRTQARAHFSLEPNSTSVARLSNYAGLYKVLLKADDKPIAGSVQLMYSYDCISQVLEEITPI